ncbi:MAG: GumC family protein [Myxococcota bacterium]
MAGQQAPNELGISFEDLGKIIRRRFLWLALPAGIGVVLALALAIGLPPRYEAASVIAVQPQSIAPELARPSIPEETEARYNHLQLQILSRENLSGVIEDFDLYPAEQAPREELIDRMREAITIEPLPPAIVDPRKPATLESFRIAFRDERKAIVADVANRLTRDFLAAHIEGRAKQARSANEFVEDELAKVRVELEKTRQRITAYKEEHQGELPEELLLNSQRVERLRSDLAGARMHLAISKDQVKRIEAELATLKLSATTDENDPVKRRDALELMLNRHRSLGKTDKHPDIVQTIAEITALESIIEEKAAGEKPSSTSPAMANLQRELRNHRTNIKVRTQEVLELERQLADAERRIANTPRHAAELDRLEGVARGLNESLKDLELRRVHASIGVELETDLLGEKFEVVEWAVPPDSPTSPNRPLWFIVGSILGVLVGFSSLAFREMTDRSFHSVAELQRAVALPVLASVPRIRLLADEAARRTRLRRVGISGAALLLVIGATLAFVLYERSNPADPVPAKTVKAERGDV